MTETLLGSSEPLAQAYDVALVDLDGVVYTGPRPVAHAGASLEAARALGMRAVFVTNNASREPSTVAAHLQSIGVPGGVDDIMTSAQAAAAMLAQELPAGAPVLVVGAPALRTAVTDAGLRVVASADDAPVAVVQGFDPGLGWRDLAEAVYAVRAGARFVATNLDTTLPTERGMAPGNGSLVGVVRTATGVVPASAGKPQPEIFHQAVLRTGATRPLAVGDRLDTDLAGARAAGMPGLHVLTGVSDARAVVLAVAGERPAFLARDLRGLLEPHPAPVLEDEWWRCGQAAARVRDGSLELAGTTRPVVLDAARGPAEITMNEWRSLAAAAWAAADAGTGVVPDAVPVLHVAPDDRR
ncbi:HAD-IIA family hydrolase [Georgenia faecalis]|uniref:HAD-IIA family hydrolase n=1 Tax=Georgenia faecalis TaxID=2483799 RepID=A0ABV9DDM4_9MICO|nr:HAD-IIA family hydrolase [Georgenia faecalis]